MTRSWGALGLAAAVVALTAAPAAHAATVFTVGSGSDPHLVVDPQSGALDAAWLDATDKKLIHFCRVPRGTTACAPARELARNLHHNDASAPFLLRDGAGALHLVVYRYVPGDVQAWTSSDAGSTWTGPTKLYAPQAGTSPTEPVLGPEPGQVTMASWNPGRDVFAFDLSGSEAAVTSTAKVPDAGVAFLLYDLQVATAGAGAVAVANTGGDGNAYFWSLAGGDASQVASWAGPTMFGQGSDTRVAAGPGGTFAMALAGTVFPRQLQLRKWTGAGFGGPVNVGPPENGAFPDLAVGSSGEVVAVWGAGSPPRLRVARSTNGGASFQASTVVIADELYASLDAGIASDGQGFAIWRNFQGEIRAVPLEPSIAPATSRHSSSVPGASIDFFVPGTCVAPGQRFKVRLAWRRQRRKGNLFVKVNRADFYIAARRVKVDKTVPFVQTLQAVASAAPGSTITLRARAFIKVHHGKPPKKSIRARIKVCA